MDIDDILQSDGFSGRNTSSTPRYSTTHQLSSTARSIPAAALGSTEGDTGSGGYMYSGGGVGGIDDSGTGSSVVYGELKERALQAERCVICLYIACSCNSLLVVSLSLFYLSQSTLTESFLLILSLSPSLFVDSSVSLFLFVRRWRAEAGRMERDASSARRQAAEFERYVTDRLHLWYF